MLKVSFEKPSIPIADSVKHIFERRRRKSKKEPEQKWTHKERLLILGLLVATIGLSAYLWYTSGTAPNLDFSFFSFNETIVIEK